MHNLNKTDNNSIFSQQYHKSDFKVHMKISRQIFPSLREFKLWLNPSISKS